MVQRNSFNIIINADNTAIPGVIENSCVAIIICETITKNIIIIPDYIIMVILISIVCCYQSIKKYYQK